MTATNNAKDKAIESIGFSKKEISKKDYIGMTTQELNQVLDIALSTQAREKDKECQDKINKIFEEIENIGVHTCGWIGGDCCDDIPRERIKELKHKWVR